MGIVGVLLDCAGDLFHAGGGLFQGRRLFLRPMAQIAVALDDFGGLGDDGSGGLAYLGHCVLKLLTHITQSHGQDTNLIP